MITTSGTPSESASGKHISIWTNQVGQAGGLYIAGSKAYKGGSRMLYLSQRDIKSIGDTVMMDYAMKRPKDLRYPLHIIYFAKWQLGLEVKYRKLSESGNIMGLTAYCGVEIQLPVNGEDNILLASEDTIYIEENLAHRDCEKYWRFTIAHECAHQILANLTEKRTGYSFRKAFEQGKRYTSAQIKTAEDWLEWQANALGAVLLMPGCKIAPHMKYGRGKRMLTAFGNRFNTKDKKKINELANLFGVSFSAMKIRLGELGYITRRPEAEYLSDPCDILVG
jgi:Zn-dependent peptidase ImmA (M78 family)